MGRGAAPPPPSNWGACVACPPPASTESSPHCRLRATRPLRLREEGLSLEARPRLGPGPGCDLGVTGPPVLRAAARPLPGGASPGARLWGQAGSTPTRDRCRGGTRGGGEPARSSAHAGRSSSRVRSPLP